MPASIRYTAKDSNRLRSGVTDGDLEVLTAILSSSDLSFVTDKNTRFSYGQEQETIVLSEHDQQEIIINYLDETAILQAREWYKSVSSGQGFEIDLDGGGTYLWCVIMSDSYVESRVGDTLEYSIPFKVRWTN